MLDERLVEALEEADKTWEGRANGIIKRNPCALCELSDWDCDNCIIPKYASGKTCDSLGFSKWYCSNGEEKTKAAQEFWEFLKKVKEAYLRGEVND